MGKKATLNESDLYLPVKGYLESEGYEVKGEVMECDLMAIRGDEPPLVVELKLSLNLSVLLQGVDRLSITPSVYIGIPEGCKRLKRDRKRVIKLVRMVGLGLITIAPDRSSFPITIVADPGDYRPRHAKRRKARLLGEFFGRVGDPNLGGSARRKGVMTVYRQRSLAIAALLDEEGPCKASSVALSLKEPKAREILYNNVYGWFDRVAHGTYQLSLQGREEAPKWRVRGG